MLDIEVVARHRQRLVRTRVDTERTFLVRSPDAHDISVTTLASRKWHHVEILLDNEARQFALRLNGRQGVDHQAFAESVGTPQRIVFRTGPYRLTDDVQEYKSGDDFKPGWDEPGADEPVEAAVYYLRDFSVR